MRRILGFLFQIGGSIVNCLRSTPLFRLLIHTATLLNDGRVRVTGGVANDGTVLGTAEVYK